MIRPSSFSKILLILFFFLLNPLVLPSLEAGMVLETRIGASEHPQHVEHQDKRQLNEELQRGFGHAYDVNASVPLNWYYQRARYRALGIKRWASRDPIGFSGGLNLYEFGASRPTRFRDLTGESPIDDLVSVLGLVADGGPSGAYGSGVGYGPGNPPPPYSFRTDPNISPFDKTTIAIYGEDAQGIRAGYPWENPIPLPASLYRGAGSCLRLGASPAGGGLGASFRQVLVDTNLILKLRRDPTLGGHLVPGAAVISYVSGPELRNVIARNARLGKSGLRGVPGVLDELPVLAVRPPIDLVIYARGLLTPKAGIFGDAILAAQALSEKVLLVTGDRELATLVNSLGGNAVWYASH